MPPRKRSKVEKAKKLLAGTVLREDSDDELGLEDHPWQWIYHKHDKTKITGARMGAFECHVGDTVLLKAPSGGEAWVAIVMSFFEGEYQTDQDGVGMFKQAVLQWFCSPGEIRSKKKRTDYVDNELYITANSDPNPLAAINGKARIVSEQKFKKLFPTGKVSRTSKDYNKVFICRRGTNLRTVTYTEPFIWEDVYDKGNPEALTELVKTGTVATRKRKTADGADVETPRKRQKTTELITPSRKEKATPRKLYTPSNKRIIAKKALEFTPLGTRVLQQTDQSPYQVARSTLHVSAVPQALPCREQEFDTIYTHLEAAITSGTGTCLYIAGTPGTGKTATVREVVSSLQAAAIDETLDEFIFVELNGMKITDPHQSYALLWEALKGDRVSPTHALELLEKEFSTPSPRRVPIIVLMDELDQLVTKNQAVMYNFFNWPQLRHSRLIVLAVANTMDLPERTLSNKISSRLGLTRITFPGYNHTQLMTIIQSRLEGVDQVIVEPDAIQFASRKVAAVSGDARRALDICRRAVEIAEQDQQSVTIATIKRAINEATSTPLASALRSLPLSNKVFLAALLARLRRTGITEAAIGDVVDEARRLTLPKSADKHLLMPDPLRQTYSLGIEDSKGLYKKSGQHQSKDDAVQAARMLGLGTAAQDLADAGIIGLEMRHGDRVGRVRIAVPVEDIKIALREDDESQGLGFDAS